MSALLLAILATYRPPVVVLAVQDTGFGHCGMDAHPHHDLTVCYRDSDDSVINILPKVQ
jgi:hypothetical protein